MAARINNPTYRVNKRSARSIRRCVHIALQLREEERDVIDYRSCGLLTGVISTRRDHPLEIAKNIPTSEGRNTFLIDHIRCRERDAINFCPRGKTKSISRAPDREAEARAEKRRRES